MDCQINDAQEKIFKCINEYKNFCLDAGAGSGKTYTLIKTIEYIRKNMSDKKIVCITFTNNAKNEIISRINDENNMSISTIHEFIWKNISKFQILLRSEVNKLIENKIIKYKLEGDIERVEKYENADLGLPISYKDYECLYKGIISHDTLLQIFDIFLNNEQFCKILFSSFDYIFIDEYQDTNKKIFPTLCQKLIEYQRVYKGICIGLFGDFMQNIYLEGIGKIDENMENNFEFIKKEDNFRSCENIINLNNCLRDDLQQECRNLSVEPGEVKFIYNYSNDMYISKIPRYDCYKKLHLTHRIIADELGFTRIFNTYSSKYSHNASNVLKNADERFLRYICNEIMPSIYEYKNGINSIMIKNINLEFINFACLNNIKKGLDNLLNDMQVLDIDTFLNRLFQLNIFSPIKLIQLYQSYIDSEDEEFLETLKIIPALEYYNYYLQFSDKTMLETMHGTKGNEFDNVLINIHEESKWNLYDFSKFIRKERMKDSVKERTHKLLYVACTRAKKSLVINYIVNKDTSKNFAASSEMSNYVSQIWGQNIEFEVYKEIT